MHQTTNKKTQTLTIAMDQFLKNLEINRQCSAHTLKAYKHDLSLMQEFLSHNHINWETAKEADFRNFLRYSAERKKSAKTLNRLASTLRSFYRYFNRKGQLTSNPCLHLKAPKVPRTLPRALNVDQITHLLSPIIAEHAPSSKSSKRSRNSKSAENADSTEHVPFLELRDQAILELLYSTGARLSEITSLNIDKIDLSQKQVYLQGKGKKNRISILGKPAIIALEKWLLLRKGIAQKTELALFINQKGHRLGNRAIQYRLLKRGLLKGLPTRVHPHRLRHSFASHMLESSQDLRGVQELLGHENLSSTQIYTQLNFQHLANVYDQCHPRANKRHKKE